MTRKSYCKSFHVDGRLILAFISGGHSGALHLITPRGEQITVKDQHCNTTKEEEFAIQKESLESGQIKTVKRFKDGRIESSISAQA